MNIKALKKTIFFKNTSQRISQTQINLNIGGILKIDWLINVLVHLIISYRDCQMHVDDLFGSSIKDSAMWEITILYDEDNLSVVSYSINNYEFSMTWQIIKNIILCKIFELKT